MTALAVVAFLLLGLAGWASAQTAGPRGAVHLSAGTDQLTVTVGSQLRFTLSTDQVTPGDTVDLTIVQTSTSPHTFTLSSFRNYSLNPSVASATNLSSFFNAHAPIVNISVAGTPGTSSYTFVAPPLGVYQYLCLVDSHFQAGMNGLLGSGVSPSPVSTYNGPGAPVFIITGVIVFLTVLALVLGFVIGRRRGSTDEMPPERLGYPEPSKPAEPRR